MVYQDLSLCDTVDVAGNLFMGREPMKSLLGIPFLDEARMHADAGDAKRARDLHSRYPAAGAKSLRRPAPPLPRAAAFDPKVLIMDEPTAALAVAEVEAVLELIRRVSARGVSVILITHRLQDLFPGL